MLPKLVSIASARLIAQRLVGEPFAGAVAAVGRFGAVQAQDFGAAKWALGLRTDDDEAKLDDLLDRGAILRTHVLRPTWHFVLPEDADWLLELTSPRIRAGLVARHRDLELDAATATRAYTAFASALCGGRHRNRAELAEVLVAEGISPAGQRLAHLLMGAELDRLIISGPRRGKQPTYALFEERVPRGAPIDRDEALTRLACRYFESHGPAQLADFVWWSGLTVADARAGIAMAGDALPSETVDGKRYWFGATGAGSEAGVAGVAGVAHFLPNFDEYLVAFRDRSAAVDPDLRFDSRTFAFGSLSLLSNVLTIGGRVRGAWRRTDKRDQTSLSLRLLGPVDRVEQASLDEAALRFSRFLSRPVAVVLADRA